MAIEYKGAINSFPTETLTHIFCHCDNPQSLGRIEQVCKKWKEVIDQDKNQTLWRNLLFKKDPSLGSVHDPKKTLELRRQRVYIDYSVLNAGGLITTNSRVLGLIEMIPFARETVAVAWNSLHQNDNR